MTYFKPSPVVSIAVVSSGRGTTASGGGNGSGNGNSSDEDDDGDNDDDDSDDDVVILNPTTTTTTAAIVSTPSPSDILNHRRACFACIVSAPQPTDDHVTVRIGSSNLSSGHGGDATIVTRVPLDLICPPLTIEQVLQALQHFDKDEALVHITR